MSVGRGAARVTFGPTQTYVLPTVRPIVILVLALAGLSARAQELNCDVSLSRQALSGSEFAYLDDLRDAVARYLNARSWTDDVYESNERIDCRVQIALTEARSQTEFAAQLVVQASRPIYGTGQRTTTVLLSDDAWVFTYTRGQNLVQDPNRYDPLTSVLDFYANLVLGYDYDSFALAGGTPFFERARRTAELARSTGADGWGGDLSEDRSRTALVQELLDPTFVSLRAVHYAYHYTVLDHFVEQPQVAWTDALATLGQLHELFLQFNRRRYATDVFFTAKHQEIADLLRDAPQRNEAYALLSEMDASHLSTYDALVSN